MSAQQRGGTCILYCASASLTTDRVLAEGKRYRPGQPRNVDRRHKHQMLARRCALIGQ